MIYRAPLSFVCPILLLGIILICLLTLPMCGANLESLGSTIYWMRFSRTLLAMIAGGGLALAGLIFQAMFRNPLATPYTLGVASGASFGAALYMQTGLPALMLASCGFSGISLGAFGGAITAMIIVFLLSRVKNSSSEQMLLAGVAVNFFFASFIVLIQCIAAPHSALQILRWTMGGVQSAILVDSFQLAPPVILAACCLAYFSRELNLLATGAERAKSLGVHVTRTRFLLFAISSLLVGGIVAVTGPIGFVGLMVPHITRKWIGPNHIELIPTTFLVGSLFLALCDTLGRTLSYPAEIPVGVITGLLGGPFFLWLLLHSSENQ
ncbi:MAG: FecCD family ABC transporter permease [Thermoguttaceae bacterium]